MPQPGSEQIWLILGTVGMFLGMAAFIWMGRDVTDPKKKKIYVVTIFIPAIAFTSYLSMALGYGLTTVTVDGTTLDIYWARYADWLFTTPLLLYDLALLADADRPTIATLVGLDVAMIVTGLLGALTGGSATVAGLSVTGRRLVWWGVSCGFLLVLLYILLGQMTEQARKQPGDVGSTFTTLRNLTAGLWILYPIVWIIGTEGVLGDPGLISLNVETALFMVLDLSAKVGFGFILLRSRSAIEGATTTESEPAAAAGGD